ncbi:MAG: hypothetical protein IAF38_00705 [Bacteroidia bacterium]|nr:hypothetical protein [Bacteroidia bacterium]
MKTKQICAALISSAILISCGGGKKEETSVADSSGTKKDTMQTAAVPAGAPDPFKDITKSASAAAKGDLVLIPSYNWIEESVSKGLDKTTFIYYNGTMSEPGDQTSKIEYTFDGVKEVPNYWFIALPKGATAKKGDILLTWWQSGSGMQRAIVTDDKNPAEPVVNYIDIDWTNPAKNSKGVGYGQVEEQLKPNSFKVLTSAWEPGTSVAVSKDGEFKDATIINVSGEKILVKGFGGVMYTADKSACTPIDIKPSVKAGDDVQTPWASGSYYNTKVIKVDAKMGRVWVKDKFGDEPRVVEFGSVTKGLAIPK